MTMRLNQFCCCCTTRTGALVIGTLGWILTLLQIFAAADPREEERDQDLHKDLAEHIYGKDYVDPYEKHYTNSIYFKVGYGLVSLLVCVLLVVGVYKKNKGYILPWLVLKGFEATLLAILTVILFFIACMHAVGLLFLIFFILVLATALQWYFWLCIWSHYKDLSEEPAVNMAYSVANPCPPQYTEKASNMA